MSNKRNPGVRVFLVDADDSLRRRIDAALDGTGIKYSDFFRACIEDRLDEIAEADAKIAAERAARVRISGRVCDKALRDYNLARLLDASARFA